RLRTLAFRVIAAHLRSRGISFREAHDELVAIGSPRPEAFTTVMRAFRGGGSTKDAIYLRGLVRLFEHVQAGLDLESLYLGKVSFEAVPLVAELVTRGVLTSGPLKPRFLDEVDAQKRVQEIRNGRAVIDLGGRAA
ncbi:MAG: tyrosine/phenylalanine carboxypeptidase domain-containing protein, partial [Acidimicrobiia bacterium]